MDWRASITADWHKLRDLPARERLILIQAAAMFPVVALCQKTFPVKRIHALLSRISEAGRTDPKRGGHRVRANDVARLVQVAARRGMTRPSCLPQSLVLWTLLRRHGFEASIRFGVRKHDGAIEAHAWVELEGRVLNDAGNAREMFTPFDRTMPFDQARLP